MTAEAIRAADRDHPSAGRASWPGCPSGELGKWAACNPAVVKIDGTPVRPRRPQRRICEDPDGGTQRGAWPRRWRPQTTVDTSHSDGPPRSSLVPRAGPRRCGWDRSEARVRTAAHSRAGASPQCSRLYGARAWSSATLPTSRELRSTMEVASSASIRAFRVTTGGPLYLADIVGDKVTPHSVGRPAS